MSFTTSAYATDEPIAINGSHKPASTGPRITRRETWVDIGKEYEGFKAKLWVNYPRGLIDDLNQNEDADIRKRALGKMVVEHNGWLDYDGTPFPPASEPAFWDAIPDELAAMLIALVNREAGKLAYALATQPRTR